MRVRTNKPFRDLKENVVRHVNSEFEVDKERYQELEKRLPGFVSPTSDITEKESDQQPSAVKKKRGRKTKDAEHGKA